jgi:predicted ester cyclase
MAGKMLTVNDREEAGMSTQDNKDLIRRYMQAIDDNHTSDWSILDDYIAEDVIVHNPLAAGVSLDREGMKHGSEIFRVTSPGARHEIRMQLAEGDLVVSHIMGRGVHQGELLRNPRDEQGCRDRRDRDPSRPRRKDRRILVGHRRRARTAAGRRPAMAADLTATPRSTHKQRAVEAALSLSGTAFRPRCARPQTRREPSTRGCPNLCIPHGNRTGDRPTTQ